MFGRRCSLCGGKLNGRNVCKECGLDNTKSDKYYKINQSNCDDMPLTHVHEEKWQENMTDKKQWKKEKVVTKSDYSYKKNQSQKKPKKQKKGKAGVVVSVLVVVLGLVSSLAGVFENLIDTSYESVEVEYDPYESLGNTHPADGEYVSYTLTSGEYIVGVHLAEGDYQASVPYDFDTVQVTDKENGVYLYEYPAEETHYLNDLRLFNGAVVTITTQTEIVLESENAQMQTMSTMIDNPLKESYQLKKNYEAEAGLDFEAGVYDVYTDADYAYITLTIIEEDGSEWEYYGNWEIGKETDKGDTYLNMVLPEGVKIMCQEAGVELIPSSQIGDMDYSGYYY